MPTPHTRRIVRRAVMALAVLVLLMSGYVGSYVGMFWLAGRGVCGLGTVGQLQTTVFEPIRAYCAADMPGSDFLGDVVSWVHMLGYGKPTTSSDGEPMTWREWRNRPK